MLKISKKGYEIKHEAHDLSAAWHVGSITYKKRINKTFRKDPTLPKYFEKLTKYEVIYAATHKPKWRGVFKYGSTFRK